MNTNNGSIGRSGGVLSILMKVYYTEMVMETTKGSSINYAFLGRERVAVESNHWI